MQQIYLPCIQMYARRRGKAADLAQICQMQRPEFAWMPVT
jgi:hypothetical protein